MEPVPVQEIQQGHVADDRELINANTTSTINSLKMKIPNQIFHEWAGILIQCQSDRSMKDTLPTIVQKFSDVRIVQSELEAMMQGPRREAVTMMFLVIGNVPLLYFLNRDWFHTLVYTVPGKIALSPSWSGQTGTGSGCPPIRGKSGWGSSFLGS